MKKIYHFIVTMKHLPKIQTLNRQHLFRMSGFFIGILSIIGIFAYTQTFANSATIDPSLDTRTPIGLNSIVSALAIQSDGKIIAGGNFTSYKGVTTDRIVRIYADGTKDSSFNTGSGFNGNIKTLALQNDGKIIVGGQFTSYSGVTANRIIRLNTDGTRDSSFSIGGGFSSTVNILAIQNDGKIIVGGTLTNYSGTATNYITRLNTDGTIDSSFDIGSGFNTNGYVYALAVQNDGKIIVGGYFTSYKGVTANRIIRLNADGTRDSSFDVGSGFISTVYILKVQNDGKIIVGGQFTSYSGITAIRIIRLNTDGTRDTSFDIGNGFNNSVNTLTLQNDGKIVVGGDFTSYQGVTANRIIRLNTDGTRDSSFDIGGGFGSTINALVIQNNGKIVVGGNFTSYNGMAAKYITSLNTDGTRDSSFSIGGGFDGVITTLAVQNDDKIIVGGQFTSYSGITAIRYITRLNADGTIDPSFYTGNGSNNNVRALAIQNDGKIVVGGEFTTYSGITTRGIIRLNTDGMIDSSFTVGGGGFNSNVYALAIQDDGKIIVGGGFTSYSGISANYITRLNIDGTIDSSFIIGSGFNNTVNAIAIQSGNKIIVGGNFTNYSGMLAIYILRLNSDGSKDASFSTGSGFNTNGFVNTLAIQSDEKIIVGGYFTSYSFVTANRIIRLNTDGTKDLSFDVGGGFDALVNTLAIQNDGKIMVGGNFTNYSGTAAKYITSLNADGTKDASFDSIGSGFNTNGYVYALAVQSGGKIAVGGAFTSYNGLVAGYLIALYGNSDLVILPNSTDTGTVNSEFTGKGYSQINEDLVGTKSISLSLTDGAMPLALHLKNQNINLSIPAGIQCKKADNITNYSGIFSVPIVKSISSINNKTVLSAFKVGSSSESIILTGGVATLLVPTPGQNIGDALQVYYSEDNGVTWYMHTTTSVIDNDGQPFVSFTTDHFTDFAITLPYASFTQSFIINNNDSYTSSNEVTLNISTTPAVIQMRFSNDGSSRSSREGYATGKSRILPGAYGNKIVYAQFDADGNSTADATISDNINYSYTSQPGGGGGGGAGILPKDICIPDRDCSSSYYDTICGPCTNTKTGEMHNTTTSCTAYSDELNGAYIFAFDNGITTVANCISANLNDKLIRSHFAKMISQFAIKILKKSPDTKKSCLFADMGNESEEMQFYSKVACQLGLMGLHTDGITQKSVFDPNQIIDRAQFGTVLSRLLRETKYAGGEPFYTKHLDALKKEGIMNNITQPLAPELRGRAMLMLQRTTK